MTSCLDITFSPNTVFAIIKRTPENNEEFEKEQKRVLELLVQLNCHKVIIDLRAITTAAFLWVAKLAEFINSLDLVLVRSSVASIDIIVNSAMLTYLVQALLLVTPSPIPVNILNRA